MVKQGDILFDTKGNCLGVMARVDFNNFAIVTSGNVLVSYEDIDLSCTVSSIQALDVKEEKEYLPLYIVKQSDGQR